MALVQLVLGELFGLLNFQKAQLGQAFMRASSPICMTNAANSSALLSDMGKSKIKGAVAQQKTECSSPFDYSVVFTAAKYIFCGDLCKATKFAYNSCARTRNLQNSERSSCQNS